VTDGYAVTLPVRWGLTAEYRYPGPESVQVTIRFRGRRVWRHRIATRAVPRHHVLRLGVIRAELTVASDLFAGTIGWTLRLDRRTGLGRSWSHWRTWQEASVIRFDPSVGLIGGQTAVYPPTVHDAVFGDSQNSTGTIMRIHIDEQPRRLCGVGHKVKARMFPPPYPPFVFNAVACVGAFEEGGPQRYANPHSPWFNVFLGYYQLDCARPAWDRPFGFASADGGDSPLCVEDLARLGKSDWNFFSNWDYGVPEEALEPYCEVDLRSVDYVDHGLVTIAGRRWRRVDLLGTEVASAYLSDAPGAQGLIRNTLVGGVLRRGYGLPDPQADCPVSFIPQALDATMHMAYYDDDEGFHTLIFGGTAHAGRDRGLLAAQVEATTAVIAERYAGFGFP
jgi:hypothetical protein